MDRSFNWVPSVLRAESLSIQSLPIFKGLYYPIMENQMEKKLENEMETGNI